MQKIEMVLEERDEEKMKNLKEFKEEQLKSLEFRKEYESIQAEMEDVLIELEEEKDIKRNFSPQKVKTQERFPITLRLYG